MLEITTDNLHEVTAQQVFDYVVGKIREQGKPSFVNHRCVYRGEEGAKCAAGWLMSNALVEQLEALSIVWKNWWGLRRDDVVPFYHEDLIILLQDAHDEAARSSFFMEVFEENIYDLATRLNLTIAPRN